MQGNFTFQNPTRLHFGKESLAKLGDELKNYGPKVMLTYGGGSIKSFLISHSEDAKRKFTDDEMTEIASLNRNEKHDWY